MLELPISSIPPVDELVADSNITLGTDYCYSEVGLFVETVEWVGSNLVIINGIPTTFDGHEDNGYNHAKAIIVIDADQRAVLDESTLELDFLGPIA